MGAFQVIAGALAGDTAGGLEMEGAGERAGVAAVGFAMRGWVGNMATTLSQPTFWISLITPARPRPAKPAYFKVLPNPELGSD